MDPKLILLLLASIFVKEDQVNFRPPIRVVFQNNSLKFEYSNDASTVTAKIDAKVDDSKNVQISGENYYAAVPPNSKSHLLNGSAVSTQEDYGMIRSIENMVIYYKQFSSGFSNISRSQVIFLLLRCFGVLMVPTIQLEQRTNSIYITVWMTKDWLRCPAHHMLLTSKNILLLFQSAKLKLSTLDAHQSIVSQKH